MKIKITIAILIFLVILYCSFSYMPGFKGHVIDKESGKPVQDAYIICFTDYYPFGQQINVGGANSKPGSLQITKSDINGYFRVAPYWKLSGGWFEYRRIYFFKEGYIYAKEYLQILERKNVLRRNFELGRPNSEIPLNGKMTIYLNDGKETDMGETVINGYLGLIFDANTYYNHYKDHHTFEYRNLTPVFLYLLNIFNKQSNDIQKTFAEAHLVENWNNALNWINSSMQDLKVEEKSERKLRPLN